MNHAVDLLDSQVCPTSKHQALHTGRQNHLILCIYLPPPSLSRSVAHHNIPPDRAYV